MVYTQYTMKHVAPVGAKHPEEQKKIKTVKKGEGNNGLSVIIMLASQ